jgi:hypothetical protein
MNVYSSHNIEDDSKNEWFIPKVVYSKNGFYFEVDECTSW